MKTIMFYVSSLAKGGAERVLLIVAGYLTRYYKVIVLTDSIAEIEYELPKQVERIVVPPIKKNRFGRAIGALERLANIRRECKRQSPDVVIVFMEKAIPRMVLALLLTNIPVIGAIRGNPGVIFASKGKRTYANITYRLLNKVVLQTSQQKEIFGTWIDKKSLIIPNPINEEFCVEPYYGLRENRIVSVGGLARRKNQAVMIEAFSKIADKYPEMTLTIYGEGDLRESLESQIRSLNLVNRIHLPGTVGNVKEEIRKSKIFIMTSVDEGIPNALMEAMALGLPVIATDCPCGGPAYLIENEVNGLLIPMNNVTAAADAITQLLDHEDEAEKMGQNARLVSERFACDKVCEQWRKCVDEIK